MTLMTDRHNQLASLLIDIECELRRSQLWSTTEPAAEALASIEPFCVDTLSFQECLQFIFLPRMHHMLTNDQPLPSDCNITAMAEVAWAGIPAAKKVIDVLRTFDNCISDHATL